MAKIIQSKIDLLTQAVSLVKAGHRDEVLNGQHTGVGRTLMTDIRNRIAVMAGVEQEIAAAKQARGGTGAAMGSSWSSTC